MNIVVLEGRIVKEAVREVTSNGTTVSRFTLAVRRDKDTSDFIDLRAYGKSADFILTLPKGTRMLVQGRMRKDTWKDKQGNWAEKIYIIVDKFSVLSSPSSKAEEDTDQRLVGDITGDTLFNDDTPPF